jgi:hypothetical protein
MIRGMSDKVAVEYMNANFEASIAVPQTAQDQASLAETIKAKNHHQIPVEIFFIAKLL